MPVNAKPVYIDNDGQQADTTPTYQERIAEPRFRQKYPRDLSQDTQYSNSSGVSMTIPNETYTIRELLNKHTSGIMPNVARKEIWQEEVSHDSLDLQKVQRMDLAEKSEISAQQTNLIEQLEQQQKERQQQKQQQVQKSESEAKAKKDSAESE